MCDGVVWHAVLAITTALAFFGGLRYSDTPTDTTITAARRPSSRGSTQPNANWRGAASMSSTGSERDARLPCVGGGGHGVPPPFVEHAGGVLLLRCGSGAVHARARAVPRASRDHARAYHGLFTSSADMDASSSGPVDSVSENMSRTNGPSSYTVTVTARAARKGRKHTYIRHCNEYSNSYVAVVFFAHARRYI